MIEPIEVGRAGDGSPTSITIRVSADEAKALSRRLLPITSKAATPNPAEHIAVNHLRDVLANAQRMLATRYAMTANHQLPTWSRQAC